MRATLDPGAPDAGADAVPGVVGLAGLRLRNHPMALIDGRWSRVGDTVRGARLDTIDSQGAVLRHADGRRERLPWSSKTPDAAPAVASNSVRTSTP